jgi:hypothetical protein
LPGLLVQLVREANGPITVPQLAQEVMRRKFATTSGNIPRMVATRVKDLVKRGLLRPARGKKKAFIPAQPTTAAKPAATKPAAAASTAPASKPTPAASTPPAPKQDGTTASAPVKAPPTKTNGQAQPSLRVLLTQLLAKSRKPLAARELAEQALASGYKTKSKKFVDVVWVALGQMSDTVQNVPGEGYILKRR